MEFSLSHSLSLSLSLSQSLSSAWSEKAETLAHSTVPINSLVLVLISALLRYLSLLAMASAALKQQLDGLVSSMFREGLLNDQFTQLQMLQDPSNPGFVAEVITLFCEDSEAMLNELTKLLEQPVVDFQKVDAYVHQMKGSSSSVGAEHIKQACIEFRRFCEDNDKYRCLRALHVVKNEYYNLRSKFEAMVQLEERIQAYHNMLQKNNCTDMLPGSQYVP